MTDLGTQLWIDHAGTGPPRAEALKPVVQPRSSYLPKPGNGLWTSTHEAEGSWVKWQEGEGWYAGPNEPQDFDFWLLDVDPEAKLYTINRYEDLARLTERFPAVAADSIDTALGVARGPTPLDWLAVGKAYDGIHLTEAGLWATHLSRPLNLYGWDCESTFWFRWRFQNVRQTSNPWAHEGTLLID